MKKWIFLNIRRTRLLLYKGLEFIQFGKEGALVYWNQILKRYGLFKSDTQPSKKLIFHIGFRKTGTTSIQEFLIKNKSLLQRNMGLSSRLLEPSTQELRNAGAKGSKKDNQKV